MTTDDFTALAGLVRTLAEGDDSVQLILADWLEEHGDGRAERVRRQRLTASHVGEILFAARGYGDPSWLGGSGRIRQTQRLEECYHLAAQALTGCPVPHDALRAVQSARRHLRQMLVRLFPEVRGDG
jgi:uncharacterized protein (TIGR02996 family)